MVGGRPRKTAEELDAEMEDYWGGGKGQKETNAEDGAAAGQGGAVAEDDIDLIE